MPDAGPLPTRPSCRRVRLLGSLAAATGLALVIRLAAFDLGAADSPSHGHGYCYLWAPTLVSAHVGADTAIGLAYVAIAVTLGSLARRTRGRLPYSWMFLVQGV